MRNSFRAACAGCALILSGISGCRTGSQELAAPAARSQCSAEFAVEQETTESAVHRLPPPPLNNQPAVQPAAYLRHVPEEIPRPPGSDAEEPLQAELEVDFLVLQVLERNPDIRSATAAWRAAAQKYPQAISLDDPMFGLMLGPASWGAHDLDPAYQLEASQKLYWPGKRQLRGNIARAQANSAYHSVGEERLQVAEATKAAYYQYFLAHRRLAVLADSTRLLENFREIAKAKYESAEVEQQDVLLADVELAELERQRLELIRTERVARARINTLLLVAPHSPLPPPPAELQPTERLPESQALQSVALSQRPELAARASRVQAERYSAALAHKEFFPDVELVGRYDAFWQEEELRPMVGLNVNMPIYKEKRWAAVREANFRTAQEQAGLDSQVNELAFEVEQAAQMVEESRNTIAVYQERLLPTARHSVDSAQASYIAGRLDFLRLIESQRQLLLLQDRYYSALAEYFQRRATLERVIGVAAT